MFSEFKDDAVFAGLSAADMKDAVLTIDPTQAAAAINAAGLALVDAAVLLSLIHI